MAAENGNMRKFEISDPQRKGIHGECHFKTGDHLLQGSCDLQEQQEGDKIKYEAWINGKIDH